MVEAFDVQKFLREGGTQTDPKIVLRQFEKEIESKGARLRTSRQKALRGRARTLSDEQRRLIAEAEARRKIKAAEAKAKAIEEQRARTAERIEKTRVAQEEKQRQIILEVERQQRQKQLEERVGLKKTREGITPLIIKKPRPTFRKTIEKVPGVKTLITKAIRKQEQIEEAEQRKIIRKQRERETPFKELIEERDFPAVVRKAFGKAGKVVFSVSDIIREKTIGGPPITKRERETGEQIIGETLLFGAVAPGLTTTAQIERDLAAIPKIRFTGLTQKTVKGDIETVTKFELITPGKPGIKRGVARGITKTSKVPGEEDLTFIFTTAKGVVGKRGVKFPTAKEVLKDQEVFGGVELALQKSQEKFSQQIGIGRVTRAKLKGKKLGKFQRSDFIATSEATEDPGFLSAIGVEKEFQKGLAFVSGKTKTEKGIVEAVGFIKRLPELPEPLVSRFKPARIRPQVKQEQAQVLKQIVTKALETKPPAPKPRLISAKVKTIDVTIKEPVPILSKVSKEKLEVSAVQKDILFSKQVPPRAKEILKEDLLFKEKFVPLRTGVKQAQPLRGKARQRLLQEPVLKQEEKVRQKAAQLVRQEQLQSQKTKLKLRQKQELEQKRRSQTRSIISPLFPLSLRLPKKIPLPSFDPTKKKKKKLKKEKKEFKEDITFAEGFVERSLGFKPEKISRKKLAAAIRRREFGIRRAPILTDGARKRIAQSIR